MSIKINYKKNLSNKKRYRIHEIQRRTRMMEEEEYYHLELPIEAVRVIHTGLSQAVEKWSGGSPQEQEELQAMRDHFYRIMLEHRFSNM